MSDSKKKYISPEPLTEGSKIAIVSPSGAVKAQYVHQAVPVLHKQGWEVEVSPHALGRHHTYSGTEEERYADLEAAILDPDVKAIFCSRGGYGAVHLLERLDKLPLRDNPKWIIGYSDITALHALMNRHGIESIHAPMASHIAATKGEDDDSQALFDLLRGVPVTQRFASDRRNIPGEATGRLVGGNLAVFADLIATPFDMLAPAEDASKAPAEDLILFLEDVSEPVYKTERIMYQLRLAGVLDRVKGLIIGQFTEYSPDVDGTAMEDMIARVTEGLDIPVAFHAPVGHVSHNIPLVESRLTTLRVTDDVVEIIQ
ncbi:MAG: LD-carboxypeptidase [Candidatus Amulumruptor caecigallinarius]|nr:LD-carboxypeptidase [Candidatus Amulumruptor caecigallinarius]MCM1396426.1 LD-carboxypeptidase [Candidatus Amulumruptor caecigallinarius]MCM1453517.1 LD-carboxypeptidase [bacterium]